MTNDIVIIERNSEKLASVIDAVPNHAFHLDGGLVDTLSILERRVNPGDLQNALKDYNKIFARSNSVTLSDISTSASAYVKMNFLVQKRAEVLNPLLNRELVKVFHTQINKISNLIHLIKMQKTTADQYQLETLDVKISVYETILTSYRSEVESLEHRIASEPVPKELAEEIKKEENTVKRPVSKPTRIHVEIPKFCGSGEKKSSSDPASAFITDKKEKNGGFLDRISSSLLGGFSSMKTDKKTIDASLKAEEIRQSVTYCNEIPYYQQTLTFDSIQECKDIPSYSLMQSSAGYFFGKTANIRKFKYDNTDHSLLELTNFNDTIWWFMATDILTLPEEELTVFTDDEKKSFQIYFNFMCYMFEQEIGKSLTVQDYLGFKRYYNDVVQTMFRLETEQREDYYRALAVADFYNAYTQYYDKGEETDKSGVTDHILSGCTAAYVAKINQILREDIVDVSSKATLESLLKQMEYFSNKQALTASVLQAEKQLETKKKPRFRLIEMDDEEKALAEAEIESVEQNKLAIIEERDNLQRPDFHLHSLVGDTSQTPVIDYERQPALLPSMLALNDSTQILPSDFDDSKIKLRFLNADMKMMGESLFSTDNIVSAVQAYIQQTAYQKNIGLVVSGKDIYLFASENGATSVSVLNPDIKHLKNLDTGANAQLLTFYEQQIRQLLSQFQL